MAESFDWLSGVIFPYLNFFIFLGILVFFSKKPLQEALSRKRKTFEDIFLKANAAKEEAERRSGDLDRRLIELDRELEERSREIINAAKDEARRILDEGRAHAAFLKDEALRIAEAEAVRLRGLLSEDILRAVQQGVVKRVKSEFSPAEHVDFIDMRVKEVEQRLKVS